MQLPRAVITTVLNNGILNDVIIIFVAWLEESIHYFIICTARFARVPPGLVPTFQDED